MRKRTPQRNKNPVKKWGDEEKTLNYWRERAERHARATEKRQRNYNAEITDIYLRMLDNIQKQIDAFFARYAKDENITMAEARKRVGELDIKKYSAWAKKYVGKKDFSTEANERMKLYNLTMKVNRLEMLKSQIGVEMVDGFSEIEQYFDKELTEEAYQEYAYQAGILQLSVQPNQVKNGAKAAVHGDFQNATWSERIWTHQTALKAQLDTLLTRAIIRGEGGRKLARELQSSFNVSRQNAERLMITEIARVQAEVTRNSMIANGNEYYYYLATGSNPCEECKKLDGKKFKVADMQPGVNMEPMHPRCHCCASPCYDEFVYRTWINSGAAKRGVKYDKFKRKYRGAA